MDWIRSRLGAHMRSLGAAQQGMGGFVTQFVAVTVANVVLDSQVYGLASKTTSFVFVC